MLRVKFNRELDDVRLQVLERDERIKALERAVESERREKARLASDIEHLSRESEGIYQNV